MNGGKAERASRRISTGKRLLWLLLVLVPALFSGACSSASQFLKARPAEPAGFLQKRNQMNPHPGESPFHYAAHSRSWEAHERANSKREIYVAPVDISKLRKIQHKIARASYTMTGRDRPVDEMANQLRLEFAQAFIESDDAIYEVVEAPGADSVTLELSLIELDPTSVSGNAARKVGSYLFSPLVTVASFGTTAGTIAIEGRVRNSDTGEVVFHFADREADRLTLFSVNDFMPYGFIDDIIKEWAGQFEKFTRTPPGEEVKDTSFFTLNPL